MFTSFPVLLDATTLACDGVCELLLAAADRNLYRPLWSSHVLEETRKTLQCANAQMVCDHIAQLFPEARVDGFDALMHGLPYDEPVRTLLATAIVGHAQLIVTQHRALFPSQTMHDLHIDLRSPDEFLMDLVERYPDEISMCLRFISNQTRGPGMPPRLSPYHLLQLIGKSAPGFATAALLQFEIA